MGMYAVNIKRINIAWYGKVGNRGDCEKYCPLYASPAPAGITIVKIVDPVHEIVRDFENARDELFQPLTVETIRMVELVPRWQRRRRKLQPRGAAQQYQASEPR
jgi:hypothetical protein